MFLLVSFTAPDVINSSGMFREVRERFSRGPDDLPECPQVPPDLPGVPVHQDGQLLGKTQPETVHLPDCGQQPGHAGHAEPGHEVVLVDVDLDGGGDLGGKAVVGPEDRVVHLDVEEWSEKLLRQLSYAIKNQLGHPNMYWVSAFQSP